MYASKRIKERMEEDTAGYSIELVVDFLGEGVRGLWSDCRTKKFRYTSKIEVPEDTEGSFGRKFKVLHFCHRPQQYGCL